MTKIFLDRLHGKQTNSIPFWYMRQAGRYLPEYKKIRANHKNFLEFCYTPDAAAEVTIQPITRYGMSAAIIFSDILVIPDALGAKVAFEEKIGPTIVPIDNEQLLEDLSTDNLTKHLGPVYEALKKTRALLPSDKALIGFCGAPWTLACYMVEGGGSRDYQKVRLTALRDKIFFQKLLTLLTESVIVHAGNQIRAGAEAIQIFDSWAGVLSEKEFNDYSIEPMQRIVSALKQEFPHIPLIGFPRMSGEKIKRYVRETKVDAVSIDHSISLSYARDELLPHVCVQGNLDPLLLVEDRDAALAKTREIIETLNSGRFIFNLSHGIVQQTPVEHVQAISDLVRNWA